MNPARASVVLRQLLRKGAAIPRRDQPGQLWSSRTSPALLRVPSIITSKIRTMADSGGPVETSIREKLSQTFQPAHLEVINESNMHNVPRGSETHFKVVVVSEAFEKESLIKRHRLVNAALKAELDGPVHALSIQAKTPSQWSVNATVSKSPPCLGGMAREEKSQPVT